MTVAAKAKAAKKAKKPDLRLDQQLVLNRYLLRLFGVGKLEELTADLKDPALERLDENNISQFHHELTHRLGRAARVSGAGVSTLTRELLLSYDENIVSHTLQISRTRPEPIRWKYFQYLSLLFTEIYLDALFRDPDGLLVALNAELARVNEELGASLPSYDPDDLRKLAFWNATGSGKTLLMHVNILQYRHYAKRHAQEGAINRVILLTPNEGLSNQHLKEFAESGIEAVRFQKDGGGLFSGSAVEVIDIHKLSEESGEKTVAVEAFEGNNLVLVDEGHRGSSGLEWKRRRDALSADGFAFEYSATFGQAVKASNRRELLVEYAKCILFDYSYRYFYADGFGKDFRIFNLDKGAEETRQLYLTACLLAFYQQLRAFEENARAFAPYRLEKPLWVFVGGTVTAVRTEGGQKVSDVLDVLLFLASFASASERENVLRRIETLLSGDTGLLSGAGTDAFAKSFSYLVKVKDKTSLEHIYDDIFKRVFNASGTGRMHVSRLAGADGEIALVLGENDPFGVINVGDAKALTDLCNDHSDALLVENADFADSLFNHVNEKGSSLNVLIGSKKFSEGWSSWRVSTMGLMNIGRSEGSEIIQLFGRGVRLKGFEGSLKRSSALEMPAPENLPLVETLGIFGVRADYMQHFKEYLEDEGIPTNDRRVEFTLPIVKTLAVEPLKVIGLQGGLDFKQAGPKVVLGPPPEALTKRPVPVNWYPKLEAAQSKGVKTGDGTVTLHTDSLKAKHVALLDLDALTFELQRFKYERGWHNVNIAKEAVEELLARNDWYKLEIPQRELDFTLFAQVRVWQEVATALLKKYLERFYTYHKAAWEGDRLEVQTLSAESGNFVEHYKVTVDAPEKELLVKLEALKERLERGEREGDVSFGDFYAFGLGAHQYYPLIASWAKGISVSPVALNQGEKRFSCDLKEYLERPDTPLKGNKVYLLRNQSRGKGLGFFAEENFYPDFILWVVDGERQFVTFVDPKGLRNLSGLQDPKITFFKKVKEFEKKLQDPNLVLNSFIVSDTPLAQVSWWDKKLDERGFLEHHVLFQESAKYDYVGTLVERLLAEGAS
jgi:hypothetical protein